MPTTDAIRAPSALALDEAQGRVVAHESGPLLVLGGPGTGKTTVLTERFVRLATAPLSSPDRILWLVPNRAHKIELQNRLTHRLLFDEGLTALIEVPVYTWHGLAHHLVTRHYDRLAYNEAPVLLTSPEQWGDIRETLAHEPTDRWPHHGDLLDNRGFADEVVDFVIRAEQRLLSDKDLEGLAAARPDWAEVVAFYRAHRTRLRMKSRVDYPTLLEDAAELIANHDDVRAGLRRRFRHVLVDDAQELALVQQRLLRHLAGRPDEGGVESLVVVGDPDSAIETFRGAEPAWLGRFGDEFGPHDAVVLDSSYRLGPDLGEAAVSLVAKASASKHRPSAFAGPAVLEVKSFTSVAAEVEGVARALRHAHLKDGVAYEDMAILLTSPRAMLPALERALGAVEVPYSVAAPDRPLEREPAVRAVIDLARLAYGHDFSDGELVALLRSPLCGLADDIVRDIERLARVAGITLRDQLAGLEVDHPAASPVTDLLALRDLVEGMRDAPADATFWLVWERSTFCRNLVSAARTDRSHPANRDLDALVAFSKALGRFVERRRGVGSLSDYLDAISRADFGSDPWLPPERSGTGVQVLSFHAARGREWAVVAVCGVTEGAIPKGRRAKGLFDPYVLDEPSPVERARRAEAEDRRVLYVAMTRAANHCLVTTSPGPSRRGAPSRFLAELCGGEIPAAESVPRYGPLTLAEAAAGYRRVIADTAGAAPARIAALAAVARIRALDPSCTAADPAEWWWRWGWTEGAVAIRAQQESDPDVAPDKLRTSYSRIGVYENCPLQYLGQVVLGLDPDTSHNMAFGTWVHQVFEEWERNRWPDRGPAEARFRRLFDATVFPNRAMAKQFHHDGIEMIRRYEAHLRPGRATLVEKSFRVLLDGHVITGRIDRVDVIGKNVIVMDYKTSRNPVGWDQARDSLQLAIYYLAATTDPELIGYGEPTSMDLVYPRADLTKDGVQRRNQKPEKSREVLEGLPALIEGVLKEDFSPDPKADCQWCKLKPICPLWPEGKELSG